MAIPTCVFALLVVIEYVAFAVVQAEYNVELFQRDNSEDIRDAQLTSCYKHLVSVPRKEGIQVVHLGRIDIDSYLVDIKSPISVRYLHNKLKKQKVLTWDQALRSNVIKINWNYYMIVLVADSVKQVKLLIQYLKTYDNFNARARYLIVYLGREPVDKIFNLAWKDYIVNIIVIRPADTNMYTYFPYGNGRCGEKTIMSEVLGNCHEFPLDNVMALYPAKSPQTYNGCIIRAGTRRHEGHVIKHNSTSDDARVVGFQEAMINVIFKKLNLTKQSITEKRFRKRNDAYYDSSHDLSEHKSDIAYSKLNILHFHLNWYDLSHVFSQTYLLWTVPTAEPTQQWKSIILIFFPTLWYFLFGMFCVNVLAWWLISKASSEPALTFTESVLGSWLVLLNGAITFPRSSAMRYVTFSWTIFCLIIIAAYQGKLLAFLLQPVYESQISTEQELINSDLNIIAYGSMMSVLSKIESQFVKQIKTKVILYSKDKFITHVYYPEKREAMLVNNIDMRFLTAHYYLDENNKTTRYAFKDTSFTQQHAVYFQKGHPLLDQFNDVLLRVISSGLLAKWVDDVISDTHIEYDAPVDVPITMEHLAATFYILVFGLLLAFIVLVGEISYHNFSERNSD